MAHNMMAENVTISAQVRRHWTESPICDTNTVYARVRVAAGGSNLPARIGVCFIRFGLADL